MGLAGGCSKCGGDSARLEHPSMEQRIGGGRSEARVWMGHRVRVRGWGRARVRARTRTRG